MGITVVRPFVAACTLLGLIAGSACATGPATLTKADVEGQISSRLRDASGHPPDSVNCPNGLAASVGQTADCQLQVKGNLYHASVTVTAVDSGHVTLDIVETVDKGQIASEIGFRLSERVGHNPDLVRCPHGLHGEVGATLRCAARVSGQTYRADVTVTRVDGGNVMFEISIDDSVAR